jgi:hypothetical protein
MESLREMDSRIGTMNRLFVVPALAGPARDRLKAGLQTKGSSWRVRRHGSSELFLLAVMGFGSESAFLRAARPFPFLATDLLDRSPLCLDVALLSPLDFVQ